MCGIAAVVWLGENADPRLTRRLVIELLRGIEERGHDAAGIACYRSPEEVWIKKAPWSASVFAERYLSRVRGWEEARVILLHARAYTSCPPRYNVCNHPLVAPAEGRSRIVSLVHNGVIFDAEELPKREIWVDSDALLNPVRSRDRLDLEAVREMSAIAGHKAVLVTDGEKFYAFHDTSPLAYATVGDNLLVFASTEKILRGALARAGVLVGVQELPTNYILEVIDGKPSWHLKPAYLA